MADSYPKRLDRFKRWAKAMEQGATVGSPTWDQKSTTTNGHAVRGPRGGRLKQKRRRRRRRKHATQE